MTMLTIKFTRKADGTCVFACTRPDGSSTWQRHKTPFYPLHDLAHFAIETTLGLQQGFYGLLASGWNVTDFGNRALPERAQAEAALAEATAGLLDQERGTGIVYKADTFNTALRAVMAEMNQPHERLLTDDELDAIRRAFLDLAGRWARTKPGDALALGFDVVSARAG
jgi:hypothetical protein